MSITMTILTAFKAHLNARFPDWECRLMPDDPSHYFLSHPNGAVLISYAGSQFGEGRESGGVVQTRTLNIVFSVMSPNLHSEAGAIALLDELRLALTGFKPPHCHECYLVEEQFDEQQTGIWVYQLVLAVQSLQVQQCEAQAPQPKFVHLAHRWAKHTNPQNHP